jgi:hypothetical protein
MQKRTPFSEFHSQAFAAIKCQTSGSSAIVYSTGLQLLRIRLKPLWIVLAADSYAYGHILVACCIFYQMCQVLLHMLEILISCFF